MTSWRHYRKPLAVLLLISLAGLLYLTRLTSNPPGFYIDESSIAYNAYTISQTARDEYGDLLPLFFRGFGDYKNPTIVYLLALIFRLFGPSILLARLLSSVAGLATALVLGFVAIRISRRRLAGFAVTLQALLTPWLFENSRVVFEVALYPLALALFLLTLARVATKQKWSWVDSVSLGLGLGLLTYTYTIGRLLAPLLAAGLAFFFDRVRWRSVVKTWLVYAITLVPLLLYQYRHPGTLTGRFGGLTYVTSSTSIGQIAGAFVVHYVRNFSLWKLLVTGEPTNLRDHVPTMGTLLLPTMILALSGLWLIVRRHFGNPFWRFIIYGLSVAAVPASLTANEFPTLRLIAVPVFLLVLTVPALAWLAEPRNRTLHKSLPWKPALMFALFGVTLIQGLIFQWQFQRGARDRSYLFDPHYPAVLNTAMAQGRKPVYVRDRHGASGYIQAYWYATLRGEKVDEIFRRDPDFVPPDSVVITTEEHCLDCLFLLRSINYAVYLTRPHDSSLLVAPLPEKDFQARLSLEEVTPPFAAGKQTTLRVGIENLSTATWPAFGSNDGKFAIVVRNLWRDATTNGLLTDADGAAMLPADVAPGNRVQVGLAITAPRTPGDYLLEIDLAQNLEPWFVKSQNPLNFIEEQQILVRDVTWFQQPLRLKVRVQ